jgi:hypothetical protein
MALAIAGATGETGFSPMPLTLYGPRPFSLCKSTVLSGGYLSRGDFIFAEVRHFDFTVLHRQVFDQAVADALHDAAVDLSLMTDRIHDHAGVMRGW